MSFINTFSFFNVEHVYEVNYVISPKFPISVILSFVVVNTGNPPIRTTTYCKPIYCNLEQPPNETFIKINVSRQVFSCDGSKSYYVIQNDI